MLSSVPPGTDGAVLVPAEVNVFPPVGRRMRSVYTAPTSPERTAHDVTVPFAGEVRGKGEDPPAWPSCTPTQSEQIEGVLGCCRALPIVAVFADAGAVIENTRAEANPAMSMILVRRFIRLLVRSPLDWAILSKR